MFASLPSKRNTYVITKDSLMKTTLVRMTTLVYWIPISAHTTYIARVLVWSSSKSNSINDVSKVIEYSFHIIWFNNLKDLQENKCSKKIFKIICSQAMPMCCKKVYAWHSGDIPLFCNKNPSLQSTLLKGVVISLILLIYLSCLSLVFNHNYNNFPNFPNFLNIQ